MFPRSHYAPRLNRDPDSLPAFFGFVSSRTGFGYNFDALRSAEDDLSSAFEAIMKTDNSPAQSTIIPLIGSIAPWIISVVSSSFSLRDFPRLTVNLDLAFWS